MNKKYANYKIEDFLCDELFIRSSRNPTVESILFWEEKIGEDIQLRDNYLMAKSFVESINVERKEISEEDFAELWNMINYRNEACARKTRLRRRFLYAVSSGAACLAVVAGAYKIYTDQRSPENQSIVSMIGTLGEETRSENITLTLTGEEKIEIPDNNVEIEYFSGGGIAINANPVSEDIASGGEIRFNRLAVPLGKRSVLTLSDGTKLWVNAGTSVVYPSTFNGNKREIIVNGEVFMEVAPDKDKPFHVISEMLNVVVLGTSFNMRAYKNENEASVVLIEGSVKVKTPDRNITLKPNEKLTAEPDNMTISTVDVEEYISWKDGLYLFHNEKFSLILDKLSKYYGVELICDAQSADLLCSGKLDLKEDMNRVLKGLATTVPVKFAMNEGKYVFKYTQ